MPDLNRKPGIPISFWVTLDEKLIVDKYVKMMRKKRKNKNLSRSSLIKDSLFMMILKYGKEVEGMQEWEEENTPEQ